MGGVDFCAVYGCFGFHSWDVCGYFFECAFLVRGPFRGCRVINLFRSGGKKPGN